MCNDENVRKGPNRATVTRRQLVAGGGVLAGWLVAGGSVRAAPPAAPPKPGNAITPAQALERLVEGNRRYVQGVAKRHDFVAEREALAGGQNPFAAILGCADSRIAPEYAFDTGRGDLFVVRVAGNFANLDNLASLEYAVAVLGTPLILVLGHEACGAVKSTIASIEDRSTLPGHLPSLVASLTPAVRAATGQPGDLLENATAENVRLNVAKLRTATPILDAAVSAGRLQVVGGIYRLGTGQVDLLG
ncbi:MAG: carbonic anhydrase [Steroidobacteraceae bacterium]